MSYDVLLASRQMLIVFFCGRAIQTRSCSHSDQGPAPDMQNRMKRTMALTLQVGNCLENRDRAVEFLLWCHPSL
jgi:hypothetical protein